MAYAGAGVVLTDRVPQPGDAGATGFSGSFVIPPVAGSERCLVRVFARIQMPAATLGPRFYLSGMSGGTYISALSGSATTGAWRWGGNGTSMGNFVAAGIPNVWRAEFLAFGPTSEMPYTINYTMPNNGIPGQPAVACDAIVTLHTWGFFEAGAPVLSQLQHTTFGDNATGKFISSGLPNRHEAFNIHHFSRNDVGPGGIVVPYNGPTDTGIAPVPVTLNGWTLRTTSSLYETMAFWSRSNIPQPGNIRVPWPVTLNPHLGNTMGYWGTNWSYGLAGTSLASFYEDPVLLAAPFGVYRDGRVHAT